MGLPMPLFNGLKEAPIGLSEDCPPLAFGDISGRENNFSLAEGVATGTTDGLDPSNCRNRSRSICCARSGTGNGAGRENNLDQLLFLSGPANLWLSGGESRDGFPGDAGFPNNLPWRELGKFNLSDGSRSSLEKFQTGDELSV